MNRKASPRRVSCARQSKRPRKAMILVIVLVAVVLISLAGYAFSEMMLAHYDGAQRMSRRAQSDSLAHSGMEYVRAFLEQDWELRSSQGGTYDNPEYFQAKMVVPGLAPEEIGAFSVVAPALDPEGYFAGVRYGMEDESARVNLNVFAEAGKFGFDDQQINDALVAALPGMTPDIADAILDYIDSDEDVRPFGGESDYYLGLSPPYRAKNGPLETVEELLLVKGVTPQLLFGQDVNRNYQIDPFEENLPTGEGADPGDPSSAFGWLPYLTLDSAEKNGDAVGDPKVDLNQEDLAKLTEELAEHFKPDEITFIVAFRQSGAVDDDELEPPPSGRLDLDLDVEPEGKITSVLDLIEAKTKAITKDGEEYLVETPADPRFLDKLMEHATSVPAKTIPGRININLASRRVLAAIPGMPPEAVDEILALRAETDFKEFNTLHPYETWIYTEGLVSLDEMKMLMPLTCAGGDVMRAQVVGYFLDGTASSRCEILVDASGERSVVRFWRDLSHLGRGYSLETLGIPTDGAAVDAGPAP
jgi:type II secretory pathway component PulK